MRSGLSVLGAVSVAMGAGAEAASAGTQSFTTAGNHEFVVPQGITSIAVNVIGARGGHCWDAPGGRGAEITATLPVTPGQQLYVGVGGLGGGGGTCAGTGEPGGVNGGGGGGAGGGANQATGGGGGGGASIVGLVPRSFDTVLLVAAGGGGSAYQRHGGDAGTDGSGAIAGAAGTLSHGGAGAAAADVGSTAGTSGSALIGGVGGQGDGGGGGGGGGYFGGGGGGGSEGYAGAGGGGSSFVAAAATSVVSPTPTASAAGVTITWTPAPPTATISSPTPGGVYALNQAVATSFSCAEGAGGLGLASCNDSEGTTTAKGGVGHLDTSVAGVHTYTVTSTSQSGLFRTASINYTVSAPPASDVVPGGGPGGQPGGASGVVPSASGGLPDSPVLPAITLFKVAPSSFRAASSGPPTASTRKGSTGGPVSYALSVAGKVTFTVERRKGKAYTKVGTFSKDAAAAGTVQFVFTGRVGSRKLAVGSYRISAWLTTATQARSATVQQSFKIKR